MEKAEKIALFLYFPEDKTEYIPAGITLFLFMVLAGVAMYWFVWYSKKEEKEAKMLEKQLKAKGILKK